MPAILDKIKHAFKSDKASSDKTAAVPDSTVPHKSVGSATTTASSGVAFQAEKVKVIFVLGGPGAGKGTQCERLVRDYGFKHLSAGDLLRAEQTREGSTYGEMIKTHIKQGEIVPMEVTVKLLENAMHDTLKSPPTFPAGTPGNLEQEWTDGKGRFLIDGFPRKMDQALKFDETVCKSSFVLFISTTEEVMLDRLLERGKTSGRDDDNKESIVKRFRTFVETSMPVVDYYRESGSVEEVDSSPPADEVYAKVRQVMDKRLGPAPAAAQVVQAAPAHVDSAPAAAPQAPILGAAI